MKILITTFVILCGCLAYAAPETLSTLDARQLNKEFGITHYGVTAMYQDHMGYVWIGSKDGLSRFDGRKNEIFRYLSDTDTSFEDNNIRKIFGDGDHRLFIRGNTSVSIFDLHTYRFTPIRKRDVRALDYNGGMLWMALRASVECYNPDTGESKTVFSFDKQDFSKDFIVDIRIDDNGFIHLCTMTEGYYRVNPQGEIVRHIPMGECYSISLDKTGNVWVTTRIQGLYMLTPDGKVRHFQQNGTDSSPYDNVREVVQADSTRYYVCSRGGLSLLDTETGLFTNYNFTGQDRPESSLSVITMLLDRQGTLWFGTFHNGVYRFNPELNSLKYHRASKQLGYLSAPIINAIAEDQRGNLWFGTEGGGLNRLNRKTGKFTQYRAGNTPNSLSDDNIKALWYDRDADVMWIATRDKGVDRLDISTGGVRRIDIAPNGEAATDLYRNILRIEPLNHKILLLATSHGIVTLDRNTFETGVLDIVVNRRRFQIWDVLVENGSTIWFTTSSGIYSYNVSNGTQNRYSYNNPRNAESTSHCNYILRDGHGQLWFGSAGIGLMRYDRQSDQFRNYDVTSGLANDYITGLSLSRDSSKIVIGTIGGLSVFDTRTETFENFSETNGFPYSVIIDGSLFVSSTGEIFTGTLDGVVEVVEKDLKVKRHPYGLYISNIYVNNARVEPGDGTGLLQSSPLFQQQITLKPRYSVISFEVFNNDLLRPPSSHVEYMLEGFDEGFIDAAGSGNPTYTNLNPGTYTFVARGREPDSEGNFPEIRMGVVVIPPFYKSVWFAILCLTAIAVLSAYLVRAYLMRLQLRSSIELAESEKKHIEELNHTKLAFFTNVAHEFRTPLTLISGELEMLLMNSRLEPQLYTGLLSAYKNSSRMKGMVDEIIDLRKQEQGVLKLQVVCGDIVEFTGNVASAFAQAARRKEISLETRLPEDPIVTWFDLEQMRKVLYNLLSNAFKYTPQGGCITVSVVRLGGVIGIEVADNGTGIKPENLERVFDRFFQEQPTHTDVDTKGSGIGLSFSRSIVEMHGGSITADSVPGVKTVLRVELPVEGPAEGLNVFRVNGNEVWDVFADEMEPDITADITVVDGELPKVLVVEDNGQVREMLEKLFSSSYSVVHAQSGEEGIELALRYNPDIIVSDVMMPGMSGTEMCARLRAGMETSHIPIVLLTAKGAEEHIVEGLQMGADDYITKPFSVKLLLARCNNLVENRRRLQRIYLRGDDSALEMSFKNQQDNSLLTRAENIIDQNLDNPNFTIHEFAADMNMSRASLFNKIKGLTGCPPNKFITNRRLIHAARLIIQNPDISTTDITYRTGFSSSSYFIKCFKANYGVTPREYAIKNNK